MSVLPSGDCRDACISQRDDLAAPVFSSWSMSRARVAHTCCECGDRIEPGQVYERATGKWDGELMTFATCAPCAEIRKAFCCDSWVYTCLWEDAAESLFERLTIGCLDKLTTAAAKEKLLARWREWKRLS